MLVSAAVFFVPKSRLLMMPQTLLYQLVPSILLPLHLSLLLPSVLPRELCPSFFSSLFLPLAQSCLGHSNTRNGGHFTQVQCVAVSTSMSVLTMLLRILSVLLAWVYDAKIQIIQNFEGPIRNMRT